MLCISIDGKENADTDAVGGGDGRKHAQLVDFRGRLALPEPPVRDYTLTSIFFFFFFKAGGAKRRQTTRGTCGRCPRRGIQEADRSEETRKDKGGRETCYFFL